MGDCGDLGLQAVFSGRFDHAIDDKGRVSIPARFREELERDGHDLPALAKLPPVTHSSETQIAFWIRGARFRLE